MSEDKKRNASADAYASENEAAERLMNELDSPLGAQKLGDEAFKIAQEEAAKKGQRL